MKLSVGLKKLVWSWVLQSESEVHAVSDESQQRLYFVKVQGFYCYSSGKVFTGSRWIEDTWQTVNENLIKWITWYSSDSSWEIQVFKTGISTVLHQKRAYTHSGTSGSKCVNQNLLLTAHAYMHFVWKWDWMRTPICGGIHIQSHFNTKCIHAWGNNNRIWCTHLGQEVPEWVYSLFWCKAVIRPRPGFPGNLPRPQSRK